MTTIANLEQFMEWITAQDVNITSYHPSDALLGPAQIWFRGRNIRGLAFGEGSDRRGYVAIDNDKAFNKISQCPIVMLFPLESAVLKRYIRRLASNRGYKLSNAFEYSKFPRQYGAGYLNRP